MDTDYNLYGDGYLVRYARTIGNLQTYSHYIDLAKNGRTSRQLFDNLRKTKKRLKDKALVMIGINDALKRVEVKNFAKNIWNIAKLLNDKTVVWLTLPLPPILAEDEHRKYLLEKYNKHILKLNKQSNVTVIDIRELFQEYGLIKNTFFERHFTLGRKDELYWNQNGIEAVYKELNYCLH